MIILTTSNCDNFTFFGVASKVLASKGTSSLFAFIIISNANNATSSAGLMTSLPASDPGSAAVWVVKG